MAIHLDQIGQTTSGATVRWSESDSMLYALGVGAGSDPERDLGYTTENTRGVSLNALPTMATVLNSDRAFSMSAMGDFSLRQILHGGQAVVVHRTLPAAGECIVSTGMTAVHDKGANAIIETTTWMRDPVSGDVLVELVSQIVVLGEGGFGGDPGPREVWTVPERAADAVATWTTGVDQALVYRLNGDTNPLHSDPAVAKAAGFPRPILHGLCTFGFAGRALLRHGVDDDVDLFGSIRCRFAAPVVPGETLEMQMWEIGQDQVLFRCLVGDRVVLDRGSFARRSDGADAAPAS